jgi:nitrogen fixation NifU-like protein
MNEDYGDLRDLCQQLVLDHSCHPGNFRAKPEATRSVEGNNPLCGDRLRL